MVTKTITIRKEVYDKLKALKREDESFSDEIERLVEKKRDIMDFAGIWKGKKDDDMEEFEKVAMSGRETSRFDELWQ